MALVLVIIWCISLFEKPFPCMTSPSTFLRLLSPVCSHSHNSNFSPSLSSCNMLTFSSKYYNFIHKISLLVFATVALIPEKEGRLEYKTSLFSVRIFKNNVYITSKSQETLIGHTCTRVGSRLYSVKWHLSHWMLNTVELFASIAKQKWTHTHTQSSPTFKQALVTKLKAQRSYFTSLSPPAHTHSADRRALLLVNDSLNTVVANNNGVISIWLDLTSTVDLELFIFHWIQ